MAEGSLEVILPTIWTDAEQSWEESENGKERGEEKRNEEKRRPETKESEESKKTLQAPKSQNRVFFE